MFSKHQNKGVDKKLSRKEALGLLQKYGVPQVVIEHSLLVEKNALSVVDQLEANGVEINRRFLRLAAILHDVGRYKIAIEKGVPREKGGLHAPGGQILLEKLNYPELAKIAGGHFLIEVTEGEAKKLGWPISVKLPDTIEAKIIFIADKMRGGEEAEEEIKKLFEREDLKSRYWDKIQGFKEKTIKRTIAIIRELKLLGWDGRLSPA